MLELLGKHGKLTQLDGIKPVKQYNYSLKPCDYVYTISVEYTQKHDNNKQENLAYE